MWTKRGKACLILIFSTNTNCESMAYRSFRSEEYSARGVRKVTTVKTLGRELLTHYFAFFAQGSYQEQKTKTKASKVGAAKKAKSKHWGANFWRIILRFSPRARVRSKKRKQKRQKLVQPKKARSQNIGCLREAKKAEVSKHWGANFCRIILRFSPRARVRSKKRKQKRQKLVQPKKPRSQNIGARTSDSLFCVFRPGLG